jgi:hypothetical protein
MATFKLSQDEFVRGCLAITWKGRTIALFGVALAMMIMALAFRGHSLAESVGYSVGGLALLLTFVYLLTRYRLGKIYREQQSLQESIDVTIDDQQLSYSWVRGTYVLPWANVRRASETREFFILFESSAFGRMLPKRVLSPEETAIIRKHIGQGAR